MHGSAYAAWLVVAVCTVSGAYCLLRMGSAVAGQRRAAGGDALMGFGMAAMALPAVVLALPRTAWLACAVVFGVASLRTAWQTRRDRRHLHHLIGSGAMVYMAVVMAAAPIPAGHADHSGGGLPALTGLLLGYFACYALAIGSRLIPAPAPAEGAAVPGQQIAGWADRPELARVCKLALSMGMLAMLLAL